ncbi:penicillin-binding protein [Dictyobacter alpinus]|uniref:Penicillin-binding protein n=1 Tax=Dictyobacter alpinus TaxID=2014873 RepID=A0A402BC80_9CHLR|nr:serine hydrolase [Dictyobacter alpinus]GCE28910.1 penicillin-binding protein [Dictyobacter alpinus]
MSNSIPQRTYWPTTDWQTCEPEAVGLQQASLTPMQAYIDEQLPGLQGLLIVRHGQLAFERYYQGFHRHSLNSISSATKSFISALVGVALAQGKLRSVEQHMLDFFPEIAKQEQDTRKQAITLHHLLSFQTGFSEEYPFEFWRNPVLTSVQRPMVEQPGERFFYDNLSVDIISGILTRVTGMKAAAFAEQTLFKTLGIWRDQDVRFAWKQEGTGPHTWHGDALWDEQDGYPWKVTLQNTNTGSFGAHFTAREMAKLGFLYLNQGQWDGVQVIPQEYIAASTRQQSAGGPPVNANYGYLWWIEQVRGMHAFFASGYGGKYIYAIPQLDLLIVATASTEQAKIDREQHNKIRALIPDFIVPAVDQK